jgi:hypothetical protein
VYCQQIDRYNYKQLSSEAQYVTNVNKHENTIHKFNTEAGEESDAVMVQGYTKSHS